jgi:hypothetical protein
MKKLLTLVAILCIVGISCVKKEYDLRKDNLDLSARIDGSIYVPLAKSDSLFMWQFLDTADLAVLAILNGGYALVIDSSMVLPLDELSAISGIKTDTVNESFERPIPFEGMGAFPMDALNSLSYTFDASRGSGFFLNATAAGLIQTYALLNPPGVGIAAINAYGTANNALLFGGSWVNLPTSGDPLNMDFPIDIDVPIGNDKVLEITEISFKQGPLKADSSGFNFTVTAYNLPEGIEVNLDRLRLVFPPEIELLVGIPGSGVVNTNTFDLSGRKIMGNASGVGVLNILVPVKRLVDILDRTTNSVVLQDNIQVTVEYSLGGAYNGGAFNATPSINEQVRVDIDIVSALKFEYATVRLDLTEIINDLSFDSVMPFHESFELPEALTIVEMGRATLQNTPRVRLNLEFSSLMQPNLSGSIVEDIEIELEITFPQFIKFAPGTTDVDNKYTRTITFPGGIATPTINLPIQELNFAGIYPDEHNHIEIDDSIAVKATVKLRTNEFTFPDPIFDVTDLQLKITTRIDSIALKEVDARLDYSIDLGDELMTIKITDFLDELPEDVDINLDSIILDLIPHLELTINSNLQIPLKANLELIPWKNGNPIHRPDLNLELTLTPATTDKWVPSKFYIGTTTPPVVTPPWEHKNFDWLGVLKPTIPDSIQINVSGGLTSEDKDGNPVWTKFDFSRNYGGDMSFKFVAPFAFGKDFRVVMEYAFDSILTEDIAKWIEGSQILLVMETTTDIPLDITGTVWPTDDQGKRISGIDPAILQIKSANQNGLAVTALSRLGFNDTKCECLSQMRGVHIHFEMKTGEHGRNIPLKPNNFIKVNVLAEIEGGITIDLNDLLGGDDKEGGKK